MAGFLLQVQHFLTNVVFWVAGASVPCRFGGPRGQGRKNAVESHFGRDQPERRRFRLIVVPCLGRGRAHIDPLLGQLAAARKRLGGRIVVAEWRASKRTATRAIVSADRGNGSPESYWARKSRPIQRAGINLAVGRFRRGGRRPPFSIRVDRPLRLSRGLTAIYLLAEAEATGAARSSSACRRGRGKAPESHRGRAENTSVGHGGSKHRRIGAGERVDHGHHALIRLDGFADVGGYDPSFTPTNEDAELDHRLNHGGHTGIWLTGGTHAVYFPRDASRRSQAVLQLRRGPGAQYPQAPQLAEAAPGEGPSRIAPVVAAASLAPLHPLCALPFLAWLTLCAASGLALAVRARDIRLVVAAPAAMVMHLSWSVGFWSEVGAFRRPTAAGQA